MRFSRLKESETGDAARRSLRRNADAIALAFFPARSLAASRRHHRNRFDIGQT
jgi:hypothetical protein